MAHASRAQTRASSAFNAFVSLVLALALSPLGTLTADARTDSSHIPASHPIADAAKRLSSAASTTGDLVSGTLLSAQSETGLPDWLDDIVDLGPLEPDDLDPDAILGDDGVFAESDLDELESELHDAYQAWCNSHGFFYVCKTGTDVTFRVIHNATEYANCADTTKSPLTRYMRGPAYRNDFDDALGYDEGDGEYVSPWSEITVTWPHNAKLTTGLSEKHFKYDSTSEWEYCEAAYEQPLHARYDSYWLENATSCTVEGAWDVATCLSMFETCACPITGLENIDMSHCVLSARMFERTTSTDIDLSPIAAYDMENVWEAGSMFSGSAVDPFPYVSGWHMPNLRDSCYMFYCQKANTTPDVDLSAWGSSPIWSDSMFFIADYYSDVKIETINLSGWYTESWGGRTMEAMFSRMQQLKEVKGTGSWQTHFAYDWGTDVNGPHLMFYDCPSLTRLDITSWDLTMYEDEPCELINDTQAYADGMSELTLLKTGPLSYIPYADEIFPATYAVWHNIDSGSEVSAKDGFWKNYDPSEYGIWRPLGYDTAGDSDDEDWTYCNLYPNGELHFCNAEQAHSLETSLGEPAWSYIYKTSGGKIPSLDADDPECMYSLQQYPWTPYLDDGQWTPVGWTTSVLNTLHVHVTSIHFDRNVWHYDFNNAFSGARHLVSVENLSNLSLYPMPDASINAYRLEYMFWGCEALESIDGFPTIAAPSYGDHVNMTNMFAECRSLRAVDTSSSELHGGTEYYGLDTLQMDSMFSNCSSLESIDLSGIVMDEPDYVSMGAAFNMCTSLSRIRFGGGWKGFTADAIATDMLSSETSLSGTGATHLCREDWTGRAPISDFAVGDFNPDSQSGWWRLDHIRIDLHADGTACVGWGDPSANIASHGAIVETNYSIDRFGFSYMVNEAYRHTDWGSVSWGSDPALVLAVEVTSPIRPKSMRSFFKGLSNCASITGLANIDTSLAFQYNRCFDGCSSLTTLDLSGWDLADHYPYGQRYPWGYYVPKSQTGAAEDYAYEGQYATAMFRGCDALASVTWPETVKLSGQTNTPGNRWHHLDASGERDGEFVRGFDNTYGGPGYSPVQSYAPNYVNAYASKRTTNDGTEYTYFTIKTDRGRADAASIGGTWVRDDVLAALYPDGAVIFDCASAFDVHDATHGERVRAWSDPKTYWENARTTRSDGYCTPWTEKSISHQVTSVDIRQTFDVRYPCGLFYDMPNLEVVHNAQNLDFSRQVDGNCEKMFDGDESLVSIEGGLYGITFLGHYDDDDQRIYNEKYGTTNVRIQIDPTDRMFYGCKSLTRIDGAETWDLSRAQGLSWMFIYCESLEHVDVSTWDVHASHDFSSTFAGCKSLASLDVSNWDTSASKSFYLTFGDCESLSYLDTSSWDTSSAIHMNQMFYQCYSLETLEGGLSNFDVSHVTDFTGMFYKCHALASLDIGTWHADKINNPHSFPQYPVVNNKGCYHMFAETESLRGTLDVSGFDMSHSVMPENMFYRCGVDELIGTEKWDTSSMIRVQHMFEGMPNLKRLDLSGWDTSNVVTFYRMFADMASLEELIVPDLDFTYIDRVHPDEYVPTKEELNSSDGLLNGDDDIRQEGDTPAGTYSTGRNREKQLSQLFANDSSLTYLDVSGWNLLTSQEFDTASDMYYGTTSLQTVILGDGYEWADASTRYRVNSTTSGSSHLLEANGGMADDVYTGLWTRTNAYNQDVARTADALAEEYTADPAATADLWTWQRYPKYLVTYDANAPETSVSGDMSDADDWLFLDEEYAVADCAYIRNGWRFASWNTEPDGSGTSYLPGDVVSGLADVGETVTLYAQWKVRMPLAGMLPVSIVLALVGAAAVAGALHAASKRDSPLPELDAAAPSK